MKMRSHDIATVSMTRRNWTHLTAIFIRHINDLIDERDTTFGQDREELEQAIRDEVQKMLPTIFFAADKSEFPEIREAYKNIQKLAGLVVPENIEDMIKKHAVSIHPADGGAKIPNDWDIGT